jgi:hypothetical protein
VKVIANLVAGSAIAASFPKELNMKPKKDAQPDSSTVSGKVGSDAAAIHRQGGKNDFGIPARSDVVKDREGQIEGRPAGSALGNTGARGNRTTGVGSAGGEAGHDSGGDLDPDWIGLDGKGGLSAKPVLGHTDGPDDAGEPSDTFASGKPAKGHSKIKPGSHGVAPSAQGDYVDHTGGDASTTNTKEAGSVNANIGQDNGSEGEISGAEATGNVEQGGEV